MVAIAMDLSLQLGHPRFQRVHVGFETINDIE